MGSTRLINNVDTAVCEESRLTLSIYLPSPNFRSPRLRHSAHTLLTPLPHVLREQLVTLSARMGSRLPHPTTRRRAFAGHPRSSATASAYQLDHVPQPFPKQRRNGGWAVVSVLRWVLNGLRVGSLAAVPVVGSASIRQTTLRAVCACASYPIFFL